MSKLFALGALAATLLVALVAASARAGPPLIHEHANFTSDPYDDNWCGIAGTSVDRVVAHYKEDASGAFIETLNVTTVFTATESGRSMEIRQTGSRRGSAPIDNGDGTVSIVVTNSGQSPGFKLSNGPPIVLDVGLVQFLLTFDAVTGDFISFEVLKVAGPRPPGCDLIIAALT
jgi:hypothetical protein